MKNVRFAVMIILVLSVFAVPSFADHTESVPAEVWAAIYDRDGFVSRTLADAAADTINGMPAEQWAAINDRDGFRTKAGEGPTIIVPTPLYRVIATRYGFDVRARGEGAEERAWTRPSTMPQAVWAHVTNRDDFAVKVEYGSCTIC